MTAAERRPAVFLDRDGVLIDDVSLLVRAQDIRVRPEAPTALARLKAAGFRLVCVSNQTVAARGLVSESDVYRLHDEVVSRLVANGAPPLDASYLCLHHPHADVAAWRQVCDCRKPRPGLLLRAAAELDIDLHHSIMVGDRPSDIAAGQAAGCRAVLVTTGRHIEAPIVSVDGPIDAHPDTTARDLDEATAWIVDTRGLRPAEDAAS